MKYLFICILFICCVNEKKKESVAASVKSSDFIKSLQKIIDTTINNCNVIVEAAADSVYLIAKRDRNECKYEFRDPSLVENIKLRHRGLISLESSNQISKVPSNCSLIDDSLLIVSFLDFKYRIKLFFFTIQFSQNNIIPICIDTADVCNNFITGEMQYVLLNSQENIFFTHSGQNFDDKNDQISYRFIRKYHIDTKKLQFIGEKK